MRLEAALAACNAALRHDHGLSGLQLAVLRIAAERSPVRLGDLRQALVLHPATLGQAVDQLVQRRLCARDIDPLDRRARQIAITPAGRRLLAAAPTAGPVRLRYVDVPVERLTRFAAAMEDAIDLFGFGAWAPEAARAQRPRKDAQS